MGVLFRDTKYGVIIMLDTLYPFVYNSDIITCSDNRLTFRLKMAGEHKSGRLLQRRPAKGA